MPTRWGSIGAGDGRFVARAFAIARRDARARRNVNRRFVGPGERFHIRHVRAVRRNRGLHKSMRGGNFGERRVDRNDRLGVSGGGNQGECALHKL
jgi:hypothetical protein